MPRNPVPSRTARHYVRYNPEDIQSALKAIKNGRKSIKQASVDYQIPLTTLKNKKYGLHKKSYGGQKRLSTECEEMLASAIERLADWKIPMTEMEVRKLVKNYLDALDLPNEVFKENMPGRDWGRGFIKRHRLAKRIADNVTLSRAKISPEIVNAYFDHLEEELRGIPPDNIFNYDETNLTDDPGAKEVIVRRGRRRVERKAEHSKQSTSIMFCGNAAGDYLPPMVVYKCGSGNVYEAWTKRGPPGTQYASTKSGWFNMDCFKQWFFDIFLPAASKLDGPVALIGDNLPSHFSKDVIEATLEHDIKFITMPPMSTHLCQPLDVAVFRTLKLHWRRILDHWRKDSRRRGAIPKPHMPKLIRRLTSHLEPTHLKSGFRSSGIYPLDRHQVLKRLLGRREPGADVSLEVFNENVMDMLREQANPSANQKAPKRGKKITHGRRIVSVVGDCSMLDEDCFCSGCNEEYIEDGDDNWILCEKCEQWYHYQCSGLDYDKKDYYDLDLENLEFACFACRQ